MRQWNLIKSWYTKHASATYINPRQIKQAVSSTKLSSRAMVGSTFCDLKESPLANTDTVVAIYIYTKSQCTRPTHIYIYIHCTWLHIMQAQTLMMFTLVRSRIAPPHWSRVYLYIPQGGREDYIPRNRNYCSLPILLYIRSHVSCLCVYVRYIPLWSMECSRSKRFISIEWSLSGKEKIIICNLSQF